MPERAPIPVCIVEEHNEAFVAWNAGLRLGYLPSSGSALLHVDEHADMAAPHFHAPLESQLHDLDRLQAFTQAQMAIYDFIVPAVHQGLFDEVWWLNHVADPPEVQELVVTATGREEQILATRPAVAGAGRGRLFQFVTQTMRAPYTPRGATTLDIDLDFFSCDQAEHSSQRLEITAAAAADYHRDGRHFLKLLLGSRASVIAEDGRHYFILRDYRERDRCSRKVTPLMVKARLAMLEWYLRAQAVVPGMVTVARSRLTGYTPEDQWQAIEAGLLEMLGRLYPIRVVDAAAFRDEATAVAR
jgi:hypothetical protein